MKALQILAIAVLALSLLWPGFFAGRACAASATLQVRAMIRPWMQFSARQHHSFFRVSSEDIRRGYVDLPKALRVELRTNIRNTIRLDLINQGSEEILIREAGSGFFQPAQNVLNIQVPAVGVPVTKNLDLRVVLSPGEKRGLHPLQVTLAPQAL